MRDNLREKNYFLVLFINLYIPQNLNEISINDFGKLDLLKQLNKNYNFSWFLLLLYLFLNSRYINTNIF